MDMRTGVGGIVMTGLLAAGVCSCGTTRLTNADAGSSDKDSRVSVAPQSSLTVEGAFAWSGVRLACSSGGDALAFYPDGNGHLLRRYHAGTWAGALALPASGRTKCKQPRCLRTAPRPSDGERPTTPPRRPISTSPSSPPNDDWSAPILVGNGGIGWWQDAIPPSMVLGLDDSGSAFATWSRIDEQATQPVLWPSAVWATHTAADGTWLADGSIDLPGGTSSSRPSLLPRAHGDAAAAWEWSDGTRNRILVARRSGSQWSAPSVIEDGPLTEPHFTGPVLAGGPTGDLIIVYQQSTARGVELLSRHSADSNVWSDAEVLAPTGAGWFRLVTNGAGGAT